MLRTAVLAALVERPGHGYDLTNRVNQRMGPMLQVDTRRVYEVLLQLETSGLASSTEEHTENAPHRTRRVFEATEQARSTYEEWLSERQPVPQARANIYPLLAFSTPEQAPQLLRMLEEYEIDCMEMHEEVVKPNAEVTSWHGRMITASRAALSEQLRAELSWIANARREIEDYLAEADEPAGA